MILWKKKIKLKSLQRFPFGILNNSYNGAPVQALVLHLKSLKKGVWNKFLTPFNSHFMQVPIIAIIEFLGIAVAFSIIREFMYHSVRTRGEGIGCGASYGVDYKETKKKARGLLF